MTKQLTNRDKKKIDKQNKRLMQSYQQTASQKTSASSAGKSAYDNAARKSARQAETGRTTKSTAKDDGFSPDSKTRSGKTRAQLYEELDRKAPPASYKYDTTDGKRDFLDRIGNLTAGARERKHINDVAKEAQYDSALMALQRQSNIGKLADAGQRRVASGIFDRTQATGKTFEEQGVMPETRDDVFHQNVYDYMSPEQKSTYYAFLGLGDRKSANRYLNSIEEGLQQQAAQKLTETIQPGNIENIQDFADVTRLGVRSGIGRFETGVQQLGNPDAVSKNYTEMAFEEGRKNMSGVTGIVADLSNTVGFMLLPVGGSFALGLAGGAGLAASNGVKALSAALFGAASGGSTYNDVLREDPTGDKFDQKVYSIINGALEGSLQYLLGGIGKLGAGGLFKATGKSISGAVAKKLSNVAKASANTPAVKNLIRALVGGSKWAAGASDEALEEWLQAVLDPVMRNYVLGENNEVQLFGEDQLYAAFLGALGATVMNAPSNIGSAVNAEQVLEETVAKQEAKAAERTAKKGNTSSQNIPELTEEELAAYGNDPDIAELATEIARLEEELPNRKKHQRDKAQKHINDLKKKLADLVEKKRGQEQAAPEEGNVPLPPPAPVDENAEAAPTDYGSLRNYNPQRGRVSPAGSAGADLFTRGVGVARPNTPGGDLINAGVKRGVPGGMSDEDIESIIRDLHNSNPANAQAQGQPSTRGMRPGDARRQNVQQGRAQQQARQQAVETFRNDVAEGISYRKGMDPEEYDQFIRNAEANFRVRARQAGMSEEEIEAEVAAQRATLPKRAVKKTPDQYEDMPPMPAEEEQTAETNKVTDEDIDTLQKELADKEEQLRQLEEKVKANNEEIKQRTGEVEKTTPPTETAAEEEQESFENEKYTPAELVERYRSDMKEARTMYRKNMSADNYEQYVYNLTNSFRNDAEEAGMSSKDIEKEIARQGGPTKVMRESGLVTDEDIDEALGTKEKTPQSTENKDELKNVFDALDNDEITTDQAYDEVAAMLNEENAQRKAGETDQLDEYTQKKAGPEVNVTEGRIEVKFPRYADEETRQQLKDAGFSWDKYAKIWWGGDNNANRAMVEDLTGVKLTEDEFKPEVRRIPKEGLNNDGGRRSEVLGDTAKRNVRPDVRSRVQRVLEEYERTEASGKYPGDAAPKTGTVKDVEESKKRIYEISRANLPDVAVPEVQRYLSSDVKIKIVDDAFLDNVDSSSPEWQKVLQIRQDFRDGKYAPGYKPVFFIPSTASTVSLASGYKEVHFEAITHPVVHKVFFRLDGIGDLTQTADHEKFHTWVNEYPKLRFYVLAKLQQAGMEQKQLDGLIGLVAGARWKYLKDNKIFDSLQYYTYAEEILAELFSRAKWGIDLTSVPENDRAYYPRYAFGFGVLDNSKDAYYILGERAKWENVVNDAVFEFFELTNNNKEQDISKTIRKAQDSGFLTPSKIDFTIIDQMVNNSKDGMRSVYDAWDTHSFVDKRTEKKNPATFDNINHTLDNIDQLAVDPGNHFSQEDIDVLRSVIKSVRSMFQDARGLREISPDYENINEHDIHSELKKIEIALNPKLKGFAAALNPSIKTDINDIITRLYGMEKAFGPAVRYNSLGVTVPSSTFTPNKSGETPVENMIPEIRDIWENLPDSVKEHITKHLDDINAEAWKNIVKKGGVDSVSGTLLKAKNWTAPQLEMAVEVGKYFADHGETQRAADIFAKVAGQQTDFGRAIKYLHTLQMYMPKSAAAVTHSIANDLGVELTPEEKANIELCDRIIEQGFISNSVMKEATGTFKEWLNDAREYVDNGLLDATTAAYAAAMTTVVEKTPATARQKFRALQRISLLSNPKTHFRNILGNLAEQTGAIMSRPVADMVDRALSKVTGQRTFGSGGLSAIGSNFASSIDQAVMDKKLGTSTIDNKFDEENASNGLKGLVRQKAFNEHTGSELRNTINKAANAVDEAIGFGLSLGDAPYLIISYEAALAQVMNANPELLVDGEATDEMKEMAWDVSQRRTFRDRNGVVKSLNKIRDALGVGGDTIAPYVTTPVNVVLTAIQYSPIAFGEAFCKALIGDNSLNAKLKRGESTMKTQRQIAELVGRGALGTALMLVGSLLRAAGKITGDDDDIDSQKEKNWNKAVGRMGSSIKVGDTYIDPSSLQSLSTPIMAGAAAYESRNDDEDGTDWGGIFGAAAKASMKMGNTMLEMPVLQGVADLLGGNYDDGELLSGALSLAGNAVTQLVPFGSLAKQASKAVDPYSRVQSEINAGPVERVAKSTLNNLRSMVPTEWGRKKLSQRYDVLGNPIKNDASDNTAERLYNSFINPFNTSKENANDVTDEIDRLYASLKDTDVLPSAAGNSISYGGEKYKFTSADKQEYQRIEGETNAEILSKLVNSDAYDRLSDEEKAKVLSSVYDYSANKAKANYLKKQGVDYESDAKWMDSIDEIVKTGVDVGDAMVYRFELNNIKGSDDQVFYIDSLPLNSNQKDTIDEAFVDKYRSSYIDEDRDYTNADTLALSMTSDSGREKYNNRFSHSWRGSSGNYYDAMTGEEFGHFYDAYQEGSKADEKVAAIKKMLMEMYGYNESYAYTMAYDFRKYYAAKYD